MTSPSTDRYLPLVSDSPMANAIIGAVRQEHIRIRSWLDGVTDFQACRAELLPYMLGEVPDDDRVVTGLFGTQIHRDLLDRMAEMDYYRGRRRALDILSEVLDVRVAAERRYGDGVNARADVVVGFDIDLSFRTIPGLAVGVTYDKYRVMIDALLPLLAEENRYNSPDGFAILDLDVAVAADGWSMDLLEDDQDAISFNPPPYVLDITVGATGWSMDFLDEDDPMEA